MGAYGKIDVSAYAHNKMTARRVEKLERAVAAWLANEKPGSFSSQNVCGPYQKALANFSQWSGRQDTRDDFEIALARLGYRAGVCVFNGAPFWILVLPSSLDTTLTRMAAMESRPA